MGPQFYLGFSYKDKTSGEQLHKMWNLSYEIFQTSLEMAVLDPQQLGVLVLCVIVF